MSNKVLLVGCGGSGITTLLRFNEMMSGNPEWRNLLWERVSYMVVDTEVEKASGFADAVNLQLGTAKKPIIKIVQITKGLHRLDEIVRPNFDLQKDPDALARLRPHWWHNANDEPFRAQNILNLEHGAGQCGPVSFLCAWNFLPKLEKAIDEVLKAILSHNIGENNPLENISVFVVAGFAGGTGRGSWNLIAFKIRQYLEKLGHIVDPAGIFFDASCFPNVVKSDPDQDTNTKLNALTALSELSAWMHLRDGHEEYGYSLPNLSNPDPKGKTDVIWVDPNEKLNTLKSPVSSAYLICGSNGRGHLGDNNAYHEMAAAALYSLVAGAQFVSPKTINRLTCFGSMAASTFEVDAVRLRAYFESFLRQTTIKELLRDAQKGSDIAQEALQFVGKSGDGDTSFLGAVPFIVDTPVSVSAITPVPTSGGNVSLLQRIAAKAKADFPKDVEVFHKKLESQNVKAAWAYVADRLALTELSKEKINEILGESLAEVGLSDMKGVLVAKIKEAYATGGARKKASLGRAQAVIKELKRLFDTSIKNLRGTIVSCSDSYSEAKDVPARFKRIFDDAAKRGFLELKSFNQRERVMLKNSFAMHQNYAVFFKMKPLLIGKFEEAIVVLDEIEGALATLTKTLNKVEKAFENDAKKDSGTQKGRTAYESLFVQENAEAVFASLPKADALASIYQRILKPIISEEKLRGLLLADGASDRKDEKINQVISQELNALLDSGGAVTEDTKERMEKTLKDLFKANVFLKKDFLDTHFSFEGVIKNNLSHWNTLIQETIGNPDEFDELEGRLRVFLGVKGLTGGDKVPQIKWEGFIKNMLISLVSTCKPWIEFKGDNGDYLETIALLPVTLTKDESSELEKEIEKEHNTQITHVIHRGDQAEGGYKLPLDRIVVFASQKLTKGVRDDHLLDAVTSFSYWREAKVEERLQLAEAGDGSAFFEPNRKGTGYVERERGLGYVSPLFVNDPKLSGLRWKPWAPKETVDVIKARENQVCAALLYAFLGNGLAVADPQLKAIAERFQWQLPLIKMGGGKSEDFNFTREPLVWTKKGKGAPDGTPAWEPEEKLVTSIDNVFDYLLGNGKPGLEGRFQEEAKAKGKKHLNHLVAEMDVFEKNIRPIIGEDAYAALAAARNKWFVTQSRNASKVDQVFWQKLQETAKKEDAED